MNVLVTCPHCNHQVEIVSVNCNVFRHALYKDGSPFNPHASKEVCENAVLNGLVHGCAKPFTLENGVAIKCEYI